MFAGGVTGQGSYSEGLIDKIDVIFELKCMYQIGLIVNEVASNPIQESLGPWWN